jgi:Glycosyltransferases involved in cell wall biogenesis
MRFSIIVPIYNSEKTLVKTLNSIIEQTCAFDEVILIDNNSDDASIEIIKKYANKFSIIKYAIEKKVGVSQARNLGLAKATGDYICFLDADDILVPTMLEKLKQTVKTNLNFSAYHYNFWQEYQNGKSEENRYFLKSGEYYGFEFLNQSLSKFGEQTKHMVWSFCFNSLYLKRYQLQFSTDLAIFEDVLFLQQFFVKEQTMIYVLDELLITYKYTETSSTQTTAQRYYEQLTILLQYLPIRQLNKIQRSYFLQLSVKVLNYTYFWQLTRNTYEFSSVKGFSYYIYLKILQFSKRIIQKIAR